MTRSVTAYAPALVWAGLLFYLGGREDFQGPRIDLPIDKLAHFFLYGVLGALLARGWRRSGRSPRVWPLLVAALLVGAADELHQRRVAGRSAEAADWVADAAGVLAGFAVLARRRSGSEEKGRR